MAGRRSRISIALTALDECVMDIETALRDGYQPRDGDVIEEAVAGLRLGLCEVEDIELDIKTAMRTLNVGRDEAFDGRLTARDRAHADLQAQMKSTHSVETVSASDFKPAA
jgi:hypothetical protein